MALRVAVVGGGLAGITAALGCADAGADVVLLEGRPRLGGLAHSFRRGDLDVDNGQHVFLRCCTAYRALLERLGTEGLTTLQPRLDIPVLRPGAAPARLRRSRLPAPLHLAPSLLGYAPLGLRERLSAARAARALGRLDPTDPTVDARSFGSWLTEHGQGEAAVAALWDLVGVATLNLRAADASLAAAAAVFQQGLLDRADAGDLGWSSVPLQQLHGDAAARALVATGAQVRTGARVLSLQGGGAEPWRLSVRASHRAPDAPGAAPRPAAPGTVELLEADRVVLAVPPAVAEQLLSPGALALAPGWSAALGTSPIVGVHVRYDRRVLDEPLAAGVGSPVQWVFDRTRPDGTRPDGGVGQHLVVSLSAADDLVGLPAAQVVGRLVPALADLLPAARPAQVLEAFVTREPQATFRPAPGSGALRPGPVTAAPGLAVAGAWTATGWPATMEGAVRSGRAAAAALLGAAPGATGSPTDPAQGPPALRPRRQEVAA